MNNSSKGFLLGAATAAHQVEGNNLNSDCWTLEQMPGSTYKEPSLDAVDHYSKYQEDIQMLAEAGLNAYRFSIEWARIEPSQGQFDRKEVEHYRGVLQCCHDHGLTPIVTLHHFSSPKWLISTGGWESEATVEHFGTYCKHIVMELGHLIPFICTINEANMGVQISRIMKDIMSQRSKLANVQVGLNTDLQQSMEDYYKNLGEAFSMDPRNVHPFLAPRSEEGNKIIMKSHMKAREIIKLVHPEIKVGITLSLYDHQALPGGEAHALAMQEEDFLQYLPYIEEDDFLGVQNYTRKQHGDNGKVEPDEQTRLTEAGYEFYPEALAGVLRFVAEYWPKPILVTENGISTSDDQERIEFIQKALQGVEECIQEGIDIIGYMHWSLLDNFEWQLGYKQQFGLISVDRTSQVRTPKDSLMYLGGFFSNDN